MQGAAQQSRGQAVLGIVPYTADDSVSAPKGSMCSLEPAQKGQQGEFREHPLGSEEWGKGGSPQAIICRMHQSTAARCPPRDTCDHTHVALLGRSRKYRSGEERPSEDKKWPTPQELDDCGHAVVGAPLPIFTAHRDIGESGTRGYTTQWVFRELSTHLTHRFGWFWLDSPHTCRHGCSE